MGNGTWVPKKVCVWTVLAVVTIVLTGCEPLRKKFIRQKKKDKEVTELVPVLEPIDYPRTRYSVEKDFYYHYSMWNVWQKEYKTIVDEVRIREDVNTTKKEIAIVKRLVTEVEEMQLLVVAQKQKELAEIKIKLEKILDKMSLPSSMWSSLTMKRELYRIDKDFRSKFNPENMENYYHRIDESSY